MATNDFTLNFGSNAGKFAGQLRGEISPAIEAVEQLIASLTQYEELAQRSQGSRGNPVNSLFERLDQATAEFGRLTGTLSSTFGSAVEGIANLRRDLSFLIDEIGKIPALTNAVANQSRSEIRNVTEEDLSRRNVQTKPWAPGDLDKIIGDARAARNALKRVGDINATIARNADSSADALKNLGAAIRELTLKTNTTTRQVTEGKLNVQGGHVVVLAGGVENVAGAANNVDLQKLLGLLGGVAGTPSAAVTDAKATEIAEEINDKVRNLTAEQLRGPAQRGRYTIMGSQSSRTVGFDVLPDETFEKYFSRHDYARERLEQIRASLPAPNPEDLRLFNTFRATGGKQADDVFQRIVGGTHSTIEQVRASFQGLQLGALTEGQIGRLPETLLRIGDIARQQEGVARRGLQALIQEVPDVSFQGATYPQPTGRRGRVPTTGLVNTDVEVGNVIGRAIHALDESIRSGEFHVPGARRNLAFREEARADAAAFRPIDRKTSFGEFTDATVTEARLRSAETLSARHTRAIKLQEEAQRAYDQAAATEKESAGLALETANNNLAAIKQEVNDRARELRQRRKVRQAAMQSIIDEPKTAEQARALAERSPEVQRINQQIADLRNTPTAATNAEVARLLGIHPEQTRDITPSEGGIAGLGRTASASGLRRLLETHPEVMLAKLRSEAEEDVRRFGDLPASGAGVRERLASLQGPDALAAADRILREREAEGRAQFEQSQTRSGLNITDAQRQEGIARLEQQREVLIQEGISRLSASGVTPPPTATPALRPAEVVDEVKTAPRPTTGGADTRAARLTELEQLMAPLKAEKSALAAQIRDAGDGSFRAKFDDEGAQAAFDGLVEQHNELGRTIRPLNQEFAKLSREVDSAARAEARKTATGGAGGGGRPPRTPPTPAAGGGDDGGEEPPTGPPPPRGARSRGTRANLDDFTALLGQLDATTRAAFQVARDTHGITEQTKTLTAQQKQVLVDAGRAFQADPAFARFPNAETRYKTFAAGLGLPNQRFAQATLSRSGFIAQATDVSGTATREAAEVSSRYAEVLAQVEGESARVRAALLREAVAQENLNRIRASGTATDAQMLRAEAALASAQRGVLSARIADANEPGGSLGKRLFGQRGFIEGQLRHLGQAIENIAGYTLVFTGFEKLQQLVDDGIQADVTFVRLQASLDAAGRSVGGLRTQLQGVSSATGQYLPDIVNAAAELAGVFKNNTDLVEGTRVVAELSNISQGTLDAKEAAIGLRDVTDAYGISGVDKIRAVGDEIARLSQTTGVSVKDVLESTTELAQEAHFLSPHDPRAAQRQAAVLGAFVTRATGETGEAAAEQVSRIVSTLNSGKVQDLLTSVRIPGKDGKPGAFLATREQFASGEIGQVLTNLLANFDKLTPSSQQAIFSLVGAGRQARAFSGLIRDAALAADELSNAEGDQGALAQQNARYLQTLGGQIKLVGNEFRNLGATLQQLGVFDLIGVLAESVRGLLKAFNETFGGIAALLNKNPITKNLEHLIVILGEAALAFKVFGGVAGNILGSAGLRTAAGVRSVNGVERAYYDPVTLGGAFQGIRNAPGRLVRGAGRRLFYPNDERFLNTMDRAGWSRDFSIPYLDSATPRERFAQQVNARSGGILVNAARSRGWDDLASKMNAGAVAAGNLGSSMKTGLVSSFDKVKNSALGTMAAMVAFGFVIDELVGALTDHHKTGQRISEIEDRLSGKGDSEAEAQQRGTTTRRNDVQQLAYDTRNPSIRERLGNYFHGEVGSDPNTMISYGTGAKILTALSPIGGGLIARNFMQDKVDTGFDSTIVSLRGLLQKRLDNAKGDAGALDEAYKLNQKDIKDYTKFIDDMGFNQAQKAQALAQLDGVKTKFEGAYESLKLEAQGIAEIDQLNGIQLQSLATAISQAQGLAGETLRKYPDLIKAILQNSGVPEGTQGYEDMQAAFGIQVTSVPNPARPPGMSADNAARLGLDPMVTAASDPGQTGYYQRARGQLRGLQHALRQVSTRLAGYTPSELADTSNKNVQADLQLAQSLPAQIQQLQQTIRARAAQYVALSAIAEGRGEDRQAVRELQRANDSLRRANEAIDDKTDPAYIENLKQIQDNKIKIAQLQASHALQALEIAQAEAVSPLEKANLAYEQASKALEEVKNEPGKGARQRRADARAQKAQADIAQRQAKLDQDYSAMEVTIAQLNATGDPQDALRAARLSAQEAHQKVNDYINIMGGVVGDATYNQLMAQAIQADKAALDQALNARLHAIELAIGDTTDPVEQARNALQQARAKLRFDRRHHIGDLGQDRLDVEEKEQAKQKARFDQRLGDEQTAYDLHQQSAASFLRFLNRQDHLLRTQIKGMKKGEEGYRQRVDELNEIDKAIQDVTNAAGGQFNLGDITLPTYYQVRRMATGGAASMVTNDNSSHVIHTTINGADFARVKQYLQEVLGVRAQNTRSHSQRRKVSS